MTELNASIRNIPIPHRMRKLPINEKGFPIPWFVHIDENGASDFRVIGRGKIEIAIMKKMCWLCGEPLGRNMTFVIGPMCTVNRVSSEPPSHLDCAEYAAQACPFLTNPRMRRNEKDLPPDGRVPGGIMIARNPGAMALWVTRSYQPFKVSNGMLIEIGEPERVLWYAEGRRATELEVLESIESGLPTLKAMAEQEGQESMDDLAEQIRRAALLLRETFA